PRATLQTQRIAGLPIQNSDPAILHTTSDASNTENRRIAHSKQRSSDFAHHERRFQHRKSLDYPSKTAIQRIYTPRATLQTQKIAGLPIQNSDSAILRI
ncbi:MAG: hypothetical protein IJ070_01705, partial [Firmicutes bacterium]|nr:hypothetical protein [Bacillota bacterium]